MGAAGLGMVDDEARARLGPSEQAFDPVGFLVVAVTQPSDIQPIYRVIAPRMVGDRRGIAAHLAGRGDQVPGGDCPADGPMCSLRLGIAVVGDGLVGSDVPVAAVYLRQGAVG